MRSRRVCHSIFRSENLCGRKRLCMQIYTTLYPKAWNRTSFLTYSHYRAQKREPHHHGFDTNRGSTTTTIVISRKIFKLINQGSHLFQVLAMTTFSPRKLCIKFIRIFVIHDHNNHASQFRFPLAFHYHGLNYYLTLFITGSCQQM